MQSIKRSPNAHSWPRHAVKSIDCRKRDFVIRVTDWLSDKDEPGYDVEVYIGGVYDWNQSQCFTLHSFKSAGAAKEAASSFVATQTAKLL